MHLSIIIATVAIVAASPTPGEAVNLASRDVLNQLNPRGLCRGKDDICSWKTFCCPGLICKRGYCTKIYFQPVFPIGDDD